MRRARRCAHEIHSHRPGSQWSICMNDNLAAAQAAIAAAEQTTGVMLYPELAALSDESVVKEGRRLKHAEGTSHPIRPPSEPQPRGARVRGNRRVNQGEAANRF